MGLMSLSEPTRSILDEDHSKIRFFVEFRDGGDGPRDERRKLRVGAGLELLECGRGRTESDCHPEERSDERVPAKRVLLFVGRDEQERARAARATPNRTGSASSASEKQIPRYRSG